MHLSFKYEVSELINETRCRGKQQVCPNTICLFVRLVVNVRLLGNSRRLQEVTVPGQKNSVTNWLEQK